MSKIRRRPQYHGFSIESYQKKLKENPGAKDFETMIDFYQTAAQHKLERESQEEWAINNMEYDLRTCDWIAEKCKNRSYAQNLYAALCNNDFVRNEMWEILRDKSWHCSWRYAGGIIADIRQEGDYIDWYCSGTDYEFPSVKKNKQENNIDTHQCDYVPEGVVTPEIRADLLKLGWIVVTSGDGE